MIPPKPLRLHPSALRDFLGHEAAGGVLLMAAAAAALFVANTPLAGLYHGLFALQFGPMPLLGWINDVLMTLFFLLVGLEIKRELLTGHLRHWSARMLPGAGALGGMILPAVIYLLFNLSGAGAPRGFAIPSATDIAFALGVLSLLGSRAPASLKIFLATLAILDDLGAILIIGVFYSSGLSIGPFAAMAVILGLLYALRRYKVMDLGPYLLLGVPLWGFVIASGVHGTLAGVMLACFIPLGAEGAPLDEETPLAKLEALLNPPVAYIILPLFAFANAGLSLWRSEAASGNAVFWGVALGLFLGKQFGVFGAIAIAVRAKKASWPLYASPMQIYGVCALCGVGFTMSLFIGDIAFAGDAALLAQTKLGVLAGSLASVALGAGLLLYATRRRRPSAQ